MAKQKTYSEKLKDPRWQKKRLEVLNRDEFSCVDCGDDKSTLHVHHLKYTTEPWDIENKYLITLCEDCHETEESSRPGYEKLLLTTLKEKGFLADSLREIASGFFHSEDMDPLYPPTADIISYCLRYRWEDMKKMYWDALEKRRKDGIQKST